MSILVVHSCHTNKCIKCTNQNLSYWNCTGEMRPCLTQLLWKYQTQTLATQPYLKISCEICWRYVARQRLVDDRWMDIQHSNHVTERRLRDVVANVHQCIQHVGTFKCRQMGIQLNLIHDTDIKCVVQYMLVIVDGDCASFECHMNISNND